MCDDVDFAAFHSYRKLAIKEIHLDKLLSELGIKQKEVYIYVV